MTPTSDPSEFPGAELPLNVASTIPCTEAEGPGHRFALWVQGCSLRCPGCCNPHLWADKDRDTTTVADVWAQILAARHKHPQLEGVSLIGGEPAEQDAPLAALARQCRAHGLTVMLYSGYTLEELQARRAQLLDTTDLLVDGRYDETLRTTERRWIGSTNQRLHHLTDAYPTDDPRFSEPNHAEIRFNAQGEIQLVGFPFDHVRRAFGAPPAEPKQP